MKKKLLIIHDSFSFMGGGEKLVIYLADKFDTEILVDNLNPKFQYLKNIQYNQKKNKVNFLSKILSIFYFLKLGTSSKLKNSKNIIFSGNFSFFSIFFIHKKNKNIIFYCNTPPKFLLKDYSYNKKFNFFMKIIILLFKYVFKFFYISFISKCNYVFCNSDFTKKRLEDFVKKTIKTNFIVLYPPIIKKFNFEIKYENYFLSFSRHDHNKNILTILDTFIRNQNFNLVICNNGYLTDKVIKVSHKYNNIKYLNFVNEEEYEKLLANCLAVIYIPSNEDYGMTVKESFSYSKSVIGLNSGYIKDQIINKKTGLLISNPSIEELTKVLSNTTKEKFIEYGKNAKKIIKKNDLIKLKDSYLY